MKKTLAILALILLLSSCSSLRFAKGFSNLFEPLRGISSHKGEGDASEAILEPPVDVAPVEILIEADGESAPVVEYADPVEIQDESAEEAEETAVEPTFVIEEESTPTTADEAQQPPSPSSDEPVARKALSFVAIGVILLGSLALVGRKMLSE